MPDHHDDNDRAPHHESLDQRREAAPSALGTTGHKRPPRSHVQIHVPPQVAGCGCFALSALCFLAGCVSLLVLVWGFLIPDWRTNNKYLPSSGLVLEKRLDAQSFEELGRRGQRGVTKESYRPEIKIRYEVDNRTFEIWAYDGSNTYRDRDTQQAILDTFQIGETYPCWYDPDSPDQVVLVRGHSVGAYLFLILPLGFLLIGCVGTVVAWKTMRIRPSQS